MGYHIQQNRAENRNSNYDVEYWHVWILEAKKTAKAYASITTRISEICHMSAHLNIRPIHTFCQRFWRQNLSDDTFV